jgi:hypothetical protein
VSEQVNGFDYSEARLAAHLGLARDDAKLLRKKTLAEGVHWQKKAGEIALTRAGVKKLWAALKAGPSTIDLSACLMLPREKNGAASEPLRLPEAPTFARPAQLIVKKIYPNVKVLLATDQAQRDWRVIVGNNTLFQPRMTLPAVPCPAHPGYYQLVGRLPRRKGRWN